MHVQIQGLGIAVPAGMVTQEDAARLRCRLPDDAQLAAALPRCTSTQPFARDTACWWIRRRTAIRRRSRSFRWPRAAAIAARPPLAGCNDTKPRPPTCRPGGAGRVGSPIWRPREIAHLVTVSCSGFSAPGVDIGLIEQLGLRRDVSRTNVGFMGCHGAMNGLRVAAALAKSNPGSKVLLCCVEICSIHHQYPQQFDHLVANALFSDGAAAAVISAEEPAPKLGSCWTSGPTCCQILSDAMTWRIRDHGFEMSLSVSVPALIRESLREWLEDWLFACGLAIDDIGGWIVHPGGPQILAACSEALELLPDALAESYAVLAEYGNMSSPTVLFILDRMRRAAGKLPCVMLAFGPGMTIEGGLLLLTAMGKQLAHSHRGHAQIALV